MKPLARLLSTPAWPPRYVFLHLPPDFSEPRVCTLCGLRVRSEDLSVFLAFTRSGLRLEGPTPVCVIVLFSDFAPVHYNTPVLN